MLDSLLSLEMLRSPLPEMYSLIAGADTGTYSSLTITAVDPDANLFILAEFPNYRYLKSGDIELREGTPSEFRLAFVETWYRLRPDLPIQAWCDPNTQFRTEYLHDGIHLRGNPRKLVNRVESLRVALQQHRVWLAPWLEVLPRELEFAKWPDGSSLTGKYERLKVNDHTLDCAEHTASRNPKAAPHREAKPLSFKQQFLQAHRGFRPPRVDRHMGRL